MKILLLTLALAFVTGCGEPREVTDCKAMKAKGLACVEYKTLKEALVEHKSERARTDLRARYARGEKLCSRRERLNWSQEERRDLGICYEVIRNYERKQQ